MANIQAMQTALTIMKTALTLKLAPHFKAGNATALRETIHEGLLLMKSTWAVALKATTEPGQNRPNQWQDLARAYQLAMSEVCRDCLKQVDRVDPECLFVFIRVQQSFQPIVQTLQLLYKQEKSSWLLASLNEKAKSAVEILSARELAPYYMAWPIEVVSMDFKEVSTGRLVEMGMSLLRDKVNAKTNRDMTLIVIRELVAREDLGAQNYRELLLSTQDASKAIHGRIDEAVSLDKEKHKMVIQTLLQHQPLAFTDVTDAVHLLCANLHEFNLWYGVEDHPLMLLFKNMTMQEHANLLLAYLGEVPGAVDANVNAKGQALQSRSSQDLESVAYLFNAILRLYDHYDEVMAEEDSSDDEQAVAERKEHYFVPNSSVTVAKLLTNFADIPVIGNQLLSYYAEYVREQVKNVDETGVQPPTEFIAFMQHCQHDAVIDMILAAIGSNVGSLRQRFHPAIILFWVATPSYTRLLCADNQKQFLTAMIAAVAGIDDEASFRDILTQVQPEMVTMFIQHKTIYARLLDDRSLCEHYLQSGVDASLTLAIFKKMNLSFKQLCDLLQQSTSEQTINELMRLIKREFELAAICRTLDNVQNQFCDFLINMASSELRLYPIVKHFHPEIWQLPDSLQDRLMLETSSRVILDELALAYKLNPEESWLRFSRLLQINSKGMVDSSWCTLLSANHYSETTGGILLLELYKLTKEHLESVATPAVAPRAVCLTRLSAHPQFKDKFKNAFSGTLLLALAIVENCPEYFLEQVVIPQLKHQHQLLAKHDKNKANEIMAHNLDALICHFPKSLSVLHLVYQDKTLKVNISHETFAKTFCASFPRVEGDSGRPGFSARETMSTDDTMIRKKLLSDRAIMGKQHLEELCALAINPDLTNEVLLSALVNYIIEEKHQLSKATLVGALDELHELPIHWQFIQVHLIEAAEHSRQNQIRQILMKKSQQRTATNRLSRALGLDKKTEKELPAWMIELAFIGMQRDDIIHLAKQIELTTLPVVLTRLGHLSAAECVELISARESLTVAMLLDVVHDKVELNNLLFEKANAASSTGQPDLAEHYHRFRSDLLAAIILTEKNCESVSLMPSARAGLIAYFKRLDSGPLLTSGNLAFLLPPAWLVLAKLITRDMPFTAEEVAEILVHNPHLPSGVTMNLLSSELTEPQLDKLVSDYLQNVETGHSQSVQNNLKVLMQRYHDYADNTSETFIRLFIARLQNAGYPPEKQQRLTFFVYQAVYIDSTYNNKTELAYITASQIEHFQTLQKQLRSDFPFLRDKIKEPELLAVQDKQGYVSQSWYSEWKSIGEKIEQVEQEARSRGWLIVPDKPYRAINDRQREVILLGARELFPNSRPPSEQFVP